MCFAARKAEGTERGWLKACQVSLNKALQKQLEFFPSLQFHREVQQYKPQFKSDQRVFPFISLLL